LKAVVHASSGDADGLAEGKGRGISDSPSKRLLVKRLLTAKMVS